jgi:hypothetical protein
MLVPRQAQNDKHPGQYIYRHRSIRQMDIMPKKLTVLSVRAKIS